MSWLIYDDKAIAIDGTSKVVLGRGEDCQVIVLDCLASRRHATIVVRDRRASIVDNGSRNGTIVNGERIHGAHTLAHRDRIMVGTSELFFSEQQPSERIEQRISFTPASGEDTLSTVTATGTGMMLLGTLFASALDGNRIDQAQKIIDGLSKRVAKGATSGTLSRAELVPVSDMVIRFANATSDVRWIEWLLKVHAKMKFFPTPHAAKRMHDAGVAMGLSDASSITDWLSAVHGRDRSESDGLSRAHLERLARFANTTIA